MLRILLLLFLTLGFSGYVPVGAEENGIVLNSEESEYKLGFHLEYINDPENKWTIEDVSSEDFKGTFIRSTTETPRVSEGTARSWIRVTIDNSLSEKKEWFLEISNFYLDGVEFYFPSSDGGHVRKSGGRKFPFHQREIKYRRIVFPVQISPKQRTIFYFHTEIDWKTGAKFGATLWTPTAFSSKVTSEIYGLGLYYGVMAVMILYNLFVFASVRDKSYLFYVGFIMSFALLQIQNEGLGFQYIWYESPWLDKHMFKMTLGAACGSAVLFGQYFLEAKKHTPRLNKVFHFLLVYSIITFIMAFTDYKIPKNLETLGLGCAFTALTVGTICVKKRYRPAYFFMGAWIVFIICVILVLLEELRILVIPMPPYSLQYASTLLVVILALGLADKINVLKLETEALNDRLKDINANLENIVDERTAQLREKTNDIQAMLSNMPQGLLTVTNDNKIHHEYSQFLEVILESTNIAGKNVNELIFKNSSLGSDTLAGLDAVFESCLGEDPISFEFNAHLMVKELDKQFVNKTKSLEFLWAPILNAEETQVEKLMIAIRDVTELKQLQVEAANQKRELEIIGQIISISQEKFDSFVSSSENFINSNRDLVHKLNKGDDEIINTLFRNMHTIKGNARTYGFSYLTNTVHETEHDYAELRKHPEQPIDQDSLLYKLKQTELLIMEYAGINDKKLGRKGPGRRRRPDKFTMVENEHLVKVLEILNNVDSSDLKSANNAVTETNNLLKVIGTQSIKDTLSGVIDSIPSLAAELGKKCPKISITAEHIMVKNQLTGMLKNAFMHIFRNSLDHGIESSDKRASRGKSDEGNIQLEVSVEEDNLIFKYRDDGQGLDITQIRDKAIEHGLITSEDKLSMNDTAQLIFRSGFSTAEKVTEISGRGVGMDAVKKFFEKEEGDVSLHLFDEKHNNEFIPFEFVLQLPASNAITTS